MVEIDRALRDRKMLGAGLQPFDSWETWGITLKAAFGQPLDDGLPKQRVRELWCVAGRRSGKSRMAAATSIFLSLFQNTGLRPARKACVSCLPARSTRQRRCSVMCAASLKRRRH